MVRTRVSKTTSYVFLGTGTAIMLLLVLFMAILFSRFQKSLVSSMDNMIETFVSQINESSKFSDEILISTVNQIYYDPIVTNLRTKRKLTNSEYIDAIREINDITSYSSFIDSIYVYNPEINYVFSTSQYGAISADISEFKDNLAADILAAKDSRNLLVMIPRKGFKYNQYSDTNIYSFLFFESNHDSAILLNLTSSDFCKLYLGEKPADSMIINNEGLEIAATTTLVDEDIEEIKKITLNNLSDHAGHFRFRAKLCFYAPMRNHNWIYIQILDYDNTFKTILESRNYTILALSIITLIFLSVFLVYRRRLYLPLKDIYSTISRATEEGPDQQSVMKNLNQLIEEHEEIGNLELIAKDNLLRQLLTGKKPLYEIEKEMPLNHLKIAIGYPITIFLSETELPMEQIENICPYSEILNMEGQYSILMAQTQTAEQDDAIRNLLSDSFYIYSSQISDWDALPKHYETILEAWHLRFLADTQSVFEGDYENLTHSMGLLSEKSVLTMVYLRKGLPEKTRESFADYLSALHGKKYVTVRASLVNFGNALLKLANELSLLDKSYEEEYFSYQNMIEHLSNIQSLRDYFYSLFDRISSSMSYKDAATKKVTPERIKIYIDENYTNPRLSTQTIAELFDVSDAYLARIFRKEFSSSLMNYVNELRIKEACRLLENRDIKIKDIPEAAGIENSQYFFQLFRKTTGCTPKEYRESLDRQ